MTQGLTRFDNALALVVDVARPIGTETIALSDAGGRVLALPVNAAITSPRASVSAMDGYAVRNADAAAIPARLKLLGAAFAGEPFAGGIRAGEAVRIFTGAHLPAGADRVIMQENCHVDGDSVVVDQPFGPGWHVRQAGSDFRSGEELLAPGTLLGPRQMVVAAAGDISEVTVHTRPRLSVVTTGDELAAPGSARANSASIPDSLSLGIGALAREWGAEVSLAGRVRDSLDELASRARSLCRDNDVVVLTGGASVGERDFARQMFGELGLEILFSKVAMKPGKPVWLGRVGSTLVLGLPGNPTAAMVTGRLFLAPLLAGLCGRQAATACQWQERPLATAIAGGGERETFLRARLVDGAAEVLPEQDSAAQLALAQADLLIRRPAFAEPAAAGGRLPTMRF